MDELRASERESLPPQSQWIIAGIAQRASERTNERAKETHECNECISPPSVRPFSSLPIAISSVLSSSVGTSCVREQQRSGQRETRIALRPLTAHNLGKIARCYNGPPSLAFGSPPSLPLPSIAIAIAVQGHRRRRRRKNRGRLPLLTERSPVPTAASLCSFAAVPADLLPPPPLLLLCSSSLSLLSRQILLAESACVAWNGAHSLPTCVVYLCTGLK